MSIDINQLFPIFLALAGWPALLASVINAGKTLGWIPDNTADVIRFWGNVLAFVGTAVLFFMGKIPLLNQIDAAFGTLAVFVTNLVAMVIDLGLTKVYHLALKGVPVIGYSYSLKKSNLKKSKK